MEFHEKLQELRKQRGLTQEELAAALFVSRTAVSKWESGRGYPNIDSLKALARYFSVTVDSLLSTDEALTIAEEEHQRSTAHLLDLLFGLLDCSVITFFFLPVFGQTVESQVMSVALPALTQLQPGLRHAYFALVIAMTLLGVMTLALQQIRRPCWLKHKHSASFLLNTVGALLFILSRQPYAATFLFIHLLVKGVMLLKKR